MTLAAILLFFLPICGGAALAWELPVKLRLEPLSIRARSSGPIPLRIKLEYNRPQILEGDLLLHIYNSLQMADDLMITMRYEGIVLQGQDYFVDTVLPPIGHSTTKQYLVVGWFETENGRIPLTSDPDRLDPPEPHELLTIGTEERATLVCSVSGERDYVRPSRAKAYLDRALNLDNYNPGNIPAPDNDAFRPPTTSERVQNFAASWDAFDLPADPLFLCSFDIVLLADGALSRLDDGQMKALLSWIKAGGSLCVLPTDDLLTKTHLQFLQDVFEDTTSDGPRLSLTDKSKLLVISDTNAPIINRVYGLGRATLLPAEHNLPQLLRGPTLGKVVSHLWKLRNDSPIRDGRLWNMEALPELFSEQGFQLKRVKGGYTVLHPRQGNNKYFVLPSGGFIDLGDPPVYKTVQDAATVYGLSLDLPPEASPLPAACESALLPTGIRMVPTSTIALLLLAYVITIGPIDYFLLGFFRARKLTWILFPLVTAAFTAVTVGMAHSYMQTSDTGGGLAIVDLVEDGEPVRQTNIQMQFRAAQTSLTLEHAGTFTVPARMNGGTTNRYNAGGVSRAPHTQLHYAGRFPQKYVTTQNLSQWKPELMRSMTLAPSAEGIPKIPWDDMSLVTTVSGHGQLRQHLSELSSPNVQIDAVVLNRRRRTPIFPGEGFLFSGSRLSDADNWLRRQFAALAANQPRHQERVLPDVLISAAVLETSRSLGKRNFFNLVSHVSPQGSASMEDLPMLDPTDPGQHLLIVAVREGDDTFIYRRLYHESPSVAVHELPVNGVATTENNQ